MQLERIEKRIEAISLAGFVDEKWKRQAIREGQMEMKEAIRRYNDLIVD